MAEQDSGSTYQERSVLGLLKDHVKSQTEAIETLERKAQLNFTVINIIAAIVAALNPDLLRDMDLAQVIQQRPLVIVIFALYFIIAVYSLRTLRVTDHATHPMTPTEENAIAWSICDESHYNGLLLKSYILIYDNNEKILDDKGDLVRWAHRLIFVVIGVICEDSLGLLAWLASEGQRLLS